MRCWQINSSGGIDALERVERQSPSLRSGQVRIRVRASSINYRDYATIRDPQARGLRFPTVPNSDAAGDVVEVGPGMTSVSVGDRVSSCFFQNWLDGPCSTQAMQSALGGALDGVLAEEVVLSQNGILPIPRHLNYAQGATLPCAGLTAWNALVETTRMKAGETVLLLGTGGVSIFALQFARILGLRVIITSSSDEKLAVAREMGAWQTINYRDTPDWHTAVIDLTDGVGVDAVVEVGGAGTLTQSIEACRVSGCIALIGVLTGGSIDPTAIMRKSIMLKGVYVGSRRMFEDMNRAIGFHQLQPVVHQEFPFDEARGAYHTMAAGSHLGKLVINC